MLWRYCWVTRGESEVAPKICPARRSSGVLMSCGFCLLSVHWVLNDNSDINILLALSLFNSEIDW